MRKFSSSRSLKRREEEFLRQVSGSPFWLSSVKMGSLFYLFAIRHSDKNSNPTLTNFNVMFCLLIYWFIRFRQLLLPTNHPSEDARMARRQQNRAAQDWAVGRKILDRAEKSVT